MSNRSGGIAVSYIKSPEEVTVLVEKLFDVARPGAVFGEPVQIDEHVVITASDIRVGMGFGFGGAGSSPAGSEQEEGSQGRAEGLGSGGGGGGSGGRPVAAIIAGPGGVRVEPIVDVTKIALGALTLLGAILVMWFRMRAAGREPKGH